MLSLLLFQLIISFTCLVAGFLAHTYILNALEREPSATFKPIIIYLVTGLIAITAICQWIILFHPLTSMARISLFCLLLICLLPAWKKWKDFLQGLIFKIRSKSLVITAIIITWVLILVVNSGPLMMDDTESYHIQMIKWIEEYGTVPGLANLHERYGFNSSWFSSIAFFRPQVDQYNFYTLLNGTISLWFTAYLLLKAGETFYKKESAALFTGTGYISIFCLAMLCWPMIRGNASTANYDFITTLIVFVLFSELITGLLNDKIAKINATWLIWPVFLFTVRIINYPFLLLTGFAVLYILKEKRFFDILKVSFLSLLIIVPFLCRNIFLSGYALYPSLSFDWFTVDWKVPEEKIKELLRFIKYFNRVNSGIQSIEATERIQFPQWIYAWFMHLFTYDKVVLIPAVAGYTTGLLSLKRSGKFSNPLMIIFFIAIGFQLISWFIIAPDPRFIYGSLLCGVFFAFASFNNKKLSEKLSGLVKPLFLIAMSAVFTFTVLKLTTESNIHHWLLPSKLPEPPIKIITIGNVQFNIPDKMLNNWNPRCYGTALPCIYYADPNLHLRGADLSDGFKMEK